MNYIEAEQACAVLEMERETKDVYCRYTGRKLGEIGEKPKGFDPESLPEMERENSVSHAIGEDTREAFRALQLCGRGLVRSSTLIWDEEND